MNNGLITDFPNGFPNGVAIRGIPLLNEYTGKIFFVANAAQGGSDSQKGNYNEPFLTIDHALSQCSDNNGDIIFLMPQFGLTISAASQLNIEVAGVSIIGLGQGTSRPAFVFDTSTSASILITAANVTIENVVGYAGLAALTQPFRCIGNNVWLDIEWQDVSSVKTAATAITLTAVIGAYIKLKYVGFIDATALVAAVKLNGCSNVIIISDFYGIPSTAWVQFVTAASKNVNVFGYMYTSGTTNQTKDVVDTITGTTGYANIYDGSAGIQVQGGSASSWALTSTAGSGGGGATQAQVTAIVKAACGTDGTTITDSATTVLGAIGANNANNAFDSSSVVANATGSVLERLQSVQAAQSANTGIGTEFWVSKTLTSSAITQSGVGVTLTSSGGNIAIKQAILMTDATGLAGGVDLQLYSNNTTGAPNFFVTTVASLGANATISMDNDSGTAATTPFILASGNKISARMTSVDGTGAGTVTINLLCQRLAAGATLAAA